VSADGRRACAECGRAYDVEEQCEAGWVHMDWPTDYAGGCGRYCLGCWLGAGPASLAETSRDPMSPEVSSAIPPSPTRRGGEAEVSVEAREQAGGVPQASAGASASPSPSVGEGGSPSERERGPCCRNGGTWGGGGWDWTW
jgi:hypothetical protein